ncbi:hypothetical protein VTK26DRAFT_4030 [Humicola hyalothermophila]
MRSLIRFPRLPLAASAASSPPTSGCLWCGADQLTAFPERISSALWYGLMDCRLRHLLLHKAVGCCGSCSVETGADTPPAWGCDLWTVVLWGLEGSGMRDNSSHAHKAKERSTTSFHRNFFFFLFFTFNEQRKKKKERKLGIVRLVLVRNVLS